MFFSLNVNPVLIVVGKQGQGKSYLCNLFDDGRKKEKKNLFFKEGASMKNVTNEVQVHKTKSFGGKIGRTCTIIDTPGIFQFGENKENPKSFRMLESLFKKLEEETENKVTFVIICFCLIERFDEMHNKIFKIIKKFIPSTRIILLGTRANYLNEDDERKVVERQLKELAIENKFKISFIVGHILDEYMLNDLYKIMTICDNVRITPLKNLTDADRKEVKIYNDQNFIDF